MRYTQTFTKPFSKLKNGLLENQPNWPVVVKDDALTVDTVLYATEFGPDPPSGQGNKDNAANTPGVRLEYLLHDGTKSKLSATTEGVCTITIANAGTFNAYATITWPDANTTRINFVAPSAETGTGWTATHGTNGNREANHGPYPVFMTLQEFCDTLDTFVKEGELATTRSLRQPTGWKWAAAASSANFNTRVENWGGAAQETNWALAATIFMPMTSHFNQLSSEITGARIDIGNDNGTAVQAAGQGQTRYDHQPDGSDSSTIKYGVRGTAGDGLHGIRWGGYGTINDTGTRRNVYRDIQANHGHASGPKWRMKTALALFLKNGTYTMSSGGCIVPYTYDPDRLFGGFKHAGEAQQTYMYGLWDGGADATAENTGTGEGSIASAQVVPGYFFQGPICPSAQSTNRVHTQGYQYDYDGNSIQLGSGAGEVYEPGTPLTSSSALQHRNAGTFTYLPNANRTTFTQFELETDGSDTYFKLNVATGHGINITQGGYIFIHGMDYGTAALKNLMNLGWWPFEEIDANNIRIKMNPNIITSWAYYGGTSALAAGNTVISVGYPYDMGSSLIQEGWPDSGAFYAYGGSLPGREVLGEQSGHALSSALPSNFGNKIGRFSRRPRWQGVAVAASSQARVNRDISPSAPMIFGAGSAALRISPGEFGAGRYRGSTTDVGFYEPHRVHWQCNSVEALLLSAMDATTGKHAWAEIKPSVNGGFGTTTTWPMGRNRNWPGHIRAHGTKFGVAPNLTPGAELYSTHPESGIETEKSGLSELNTSPVYLDLEMVAYVPDVPDRMTKIWFETDGFETVRGRLSGYYSNASTSLGASPPSWFTKFSPDGAGMVGNLGGAWGHLLSKTAVNNSPDGMNVSVQQGTMAQAYVANQPWLWYWGGSELLADTDWNDTPDFSTAPGGGFGIATDGIGAGGTFSDGGGSTIWRVTFDNRGMQFILNGSSVGFDSGASKPVHSFRIQQCNLNYGGINDATDMLRVNNNDPDQDLMIDKLIARQIPTAAMLPFLKESTVQEHSAGVYRTLSITAENIDKANHKYIRVSICTPGTIAGAWDGYGRAPGTPLANFTSLDPMFGGGFGSISLTDLPDSELQNGFTIRFEFQIPSNADEQTIDWNAIPRIVDWNLDFDLDPTAALAVVGETFQNDLTSPIDSKVGHIITFQSTLATADPDRLIQQVKYDFGDGTITDWLTLSVPAASVNHSIVHSYSSEATALNAVVYSKDNNGNISDPSSAIVVNIVGAEPVAVLRVIPAVVRAGQTVTFDGSSSFDPDSTALQNFRFTSGDGSSVIGPQSQNYASHTFAAAGEYKVTMTVQDAGSNTSNIASAIIKVLPANLVMPLTLNTRPSSFQRSRKASFSQTPVLDAAFPELRDSGSRNDEFQLKGAFLKSTAELDISYMEELLMLGSLIEFEWQSVNYQGVADSKTFVGRMTDFQYGRDSDSRGQTPYTATFIREASMGV